MEDNRKNFQKVCRVCVKNVNEGIHLFNITFPNSPTFVVDFLCQITSLEIAENDGLTDVLCSTCFEKLCDVFELAQMCIVADAILRNIPKDETEVDDFEVKCESNVDENEREWLKSEESLIDQELDLRSNIKCIYKKRKKYGKDRNSINRDEGSETFLEKLKLTDHDQSHKKGEDTNLKCEICNKQFKYEYLLKQHEYKHTNEKPYPCKICGRGCITADSLKRHMIVHDKNYVKKKYSCAVCSKECGAPSTLVQHMKIHTGEKSHLCSTCGKSFSQTGSLHYHQRIHTGYRPFACNICSQKFISQGVLKIHMRTHTNEKPYICDVCGTAFARSTDLKRHQSIHTGEKPALCTICGQRLSSKSHLTVHMRFHNKEKPHACSNCSKAFTTKTMLVKHKRIHTGERPYVCNVCGKAFGQSGTLKAHKNIHQNNKNTTKSEKQRKTYNLNEVMKDNGAGCVLFKVGTEIVVEEFILSDNVQDIAVGSTGPLMEP